jgi:arylsulfatase A-like enzyme
MKATSLAIVASLVVVHSHSTMPLRLLILAAALLLPPSGSGAEMPKSVATGKPNIIFLLTDDQTIGAVGCYGNKDIITPNLDALARQGVRFLNHYDTTSICMASRASVMTGLYEYRHGCNFGHGPMERRLFANSYPVKLRQAGYFTGFAGKLGFVLDGEKFEVFEKEFDFWGGGPGQTSYETKRNPSIAKYADRYPHCSRAYGAWGQAFLKAAKQSGKPFCMSISFKAPHLPATPDPIDIKLYDARETFARPLNYGVENGKHLSAQVHTSRAATHYREWVTDYDRTVRNYYARITGVDAAVGMIREELERQGLARNTVIIFTSDNGYNSGSHGFGDKVIPYEEGSKAPLIIFDPRLSKEHAGKTCGAVTGNVDMTATIFALAGVPAPKGIDGQSLLPLLTNPGGKVRDWLPLFNFWGAQSAQSMAVVSSEWKYIYWYYGGGGMTPTEELFHLARDCIEMLNLARESRFPADLATARNAYDVELAALKAKVVKGYGYEPYPVLFDRTSAWEKKEPLLRATKARGGGEEEDTPKPLSNKRNQRKKAAKYAPSLKRERETNP